MQALYVVLVAAHAACAVIGFGSLALSGYYGFSGRSADRQRRAEAVRWFAPPGRAAHLILAVPVLGLIALAVEPGGKGPAQLWDLLALAVWAVGAGTWWVRLRPARDRLRSSIATPAGVMGDPATTDLGGAWADDAGAVGRAAVVTDVAFVVALVLMLLQP